MNRVPPPSRVILCPGGNYQYLKLRNAHQQAAEIARMGIPVTILKYRTPVSLEGTHNAEAHPLEDLFELMRQLRQESGPAVKIGVIGSDAGGHLALMAATHSDKFGTGPDFVGAANPPTHTPASDGGDAGAENGLPFKISTLPDSTCTRGPARSVSLIQKEATSGLRHRNGQNSRCSEVSTISIADDTNPRELPKAFRRFQQALEFCSKTEAALELSAAPKCKG
ncbi:MAG: hypothetical protein R3F19_03315 [Verrucomicrobiales bacterium]